MFCLCVKEYKLTFHIQYATSSSSIRYSPKSGISCIVLSIMLGIDDGELNWLFNVKITNISVIHVTVHRCAGGLKKKK